MVELRPMHRKNGLLLAEMMRHGYTISTLARAAGVHYLTIWRIVNQQHNPRASTAAKISRILDSNPRQLGLKIWNQTGEPSGNNG